MERQQQLLQLTDEALIDLYLESQSNSYFDTLYERYIDRVYSRCLTMLHEKNTAADATQEIFMKIFTKLATFNKTAKFSTWVYAITYNYCIDRIRKNKKKQFIKQTENIPELAEEVTDNHLLEMEVERLKEVLETIPARDKAILIMKYQDDMSIREISNILGKSESAIKMQLKRAKEKAAHTYRIQFKESAAVIILLLELGWF